MAMDFESIGVLRIMPGDALVVHVPALTTAAGRDNARGAVQQWLEAAGHPTVPVLIVPRGYDLSVTRVVETNC